MIQDKIYWNGFLRQLKELYYLLKHEKYISCSIDEFVSHFTGKKFRDENKKCSEKIEWTNEKYLLIVLINHLVIKRFLNYPSANEYINELKKHFINIKDIVIKQYSANKTKSIAKKFQKMLNNLFPQNSGYRCKERIFYKIRNKEPQYKVLKNCGITIN